MRIRSVPRAVLIALAAVAVLGLAALAETLYVNVRSTRMVEKKDPLAKKVKRLYYAEPVEVLKREGKWARVKSGEEEGYVYVADLVSKRPKVKEKKGAGWQWLPGRKDPQFAAGTRALGPLGREYTKNNDLEKGRHVVEDIMDKMKLDVEALEKFQKEGRIGEFAAREEGR
jgi:hypothetical protein